MPRLGLPILLAAAILAPPIACPAASAAATAPVFGAGFDATVLAGSVSYKVPGGSFAGLHGTQRLPVGSVVSARDGRVRVTIAERTGGTSSGEFAAGAFRVLQARGSGAGAEVDLVGNTCVRAARLGAVAARPRHHPPKVRAVAPPESGLTAPSAAAHRRRLEIRADGAFTVVGTDAAAVASGPARYKLIDECDGTRIRDERGQVTVRRRLGVPGRLRAGSSELDYCHPHGAAPHFCLSLVASLSSREFRFTAALRKPASDYALCWSRGSAEECVGVAGAPARNWRVSGRLTGGSGIYAVRFRLDGRQLGYTLRLKAR